MFCRHCGKEVKDEAVVCTSCGCSLENKPTQPVNPEYETSKTGFGVLFALLLGLIGLIIGIVMYPDNTVARKTFIKGWVITFAITAALSIIWVIIILLVFPSFMVVA